MAINNSTYQSIIQELSQSNTVLVAVSKTKPAEDIEAMYNLGQRDFGENYVQELVDKQSILPNDIRWHFIGHLQTNKVKYIAPFVHLIHGVDSLKLLQEINKQGAKNNRVIPCLLQMYIAKEESKFGLDEMELNQILAVLKDLPNVKVSGLMGMASFTSDISIIQKEFSYLNQVYLQYRNNPPNLNEWNILSMGMSGDYQLAIECGSNMVRIGSLLFGARNYTT